MSTWQIVLGFLGLALGGGVVSGVVTYGLTAGKEWRNARREQLGRLLLTYEALAAWLLEQWQYHNAAMNELCEWSEVTAMEDVGRPLARRRSHKLHMIVAVYWPELEPELQRLIELRDRSQGILGRAAGRREDGNADDAEARRQLVPMFDELTAARKSLAGAVRAESWKLQHPYAGITAIATAWASSFLHLTKYVQRLGMNVA